MKITKGKIEGPQKVVIYGPEGIGKTTLASMFPNPVFIDTEGSTKHLDVSRTPAPNNWGELFAQVQYFISNKTEFRTLVIDTIDWAEQLAIRHLCKRAQKSGLEDFGYGKGYVYLAEEMVRLLDELSKLIKGETNIVLTAHAHMRKFEQPDEMGSYDRWEMKLMRKTAPLVKEWADMVLFANYKTHVIKPEEGKTKAQGGKRVIHTTHHPAWDAKNRHGLADELPMAWDSISHCFEKQVREIKTEDKPIESEPKPEPKDLSLLQPGKERKNGIPNELKKLMDADKITPGEIERVVSDKGYYPKGSHIKDYEQSFVNEVLIKAWDSVKEAILSSRFDDPPF